jgi:hypothetical protein
MMGMKQYDWTHQVLLRRTGYYVEKLIVLELATLLHVKYTRR